MSLDGDLEEHGIYLESYYDIDNLAEDTDDGRTIDKLLDKKIALHSLSFNPNLDEYQVNTLVEICLKSIDSDPESQKCLQNLIKQRAFQIDERNVSKIFALDNHPNFRNAFVGRAFLTEDQKKKVENVSPEEDDLIA